MPLYVRNSDSVIIFKRKLNYDIKAIPRFFYAGNRRAQVLHTRLRTSVAHLRTISGIVHAHHSCGGKQGKLPGSCLSTIIKFASIQVSDTLMSDRYLHIFWTKESNLNVSEISIDPLL